ncbi:MULTISPECIES: DUF192 domain-containing protein [unclassified Haloparvum]|uniref:DUF192 domain-containing protein n=1 Tax=Haloparvum sp. PAK95 TaxID=3418962 RepID=UPI003D2F47C4
MNRKVAIALAVGALLVAGAVAVDAGLVGPEYERTTVAIEDDETNETLATADARVADSAYKRYVGLSHTDSLGPNEGMLFVHEEPGEYAYVMRDMAFAIDIVFVAPNGTITEIHTAEPEERPFTKYEGTGLYVLEVRAGFADDRGIEPGDRVEFEL